MHVVLWRFRARPGREREFEAAYGEGGAWERLFRRAEGFLGTELMRASDGAYLTIDRWHSGEAYRRFRETETPRYREIDADCEALTIEETELGAFEV